MDARFAGSQRSGDRLRRRLAVEADESVDPDCVSESLASGAGDSRKLHLPEVHGSSDAEVQLPLYAIVPVAWWKYALGGMSAFAVGGGILAATWYAPGGVAAGSAINQFFSISESPVAGWYSSLLLAASSQLALLIWWGRSRSLKDFDGRYRLWTRMAVVWLAFSFCSATGAHVAFSEFIRQSCPVAIPRVEILAWLIPAIVMGLWITVSLHREMAGCRWSTAFLFGAVTLYCGVIGLKLELAAAPAAQARQFTELGLALAGHICVFLSMWLHVRHVIHCTPDPTRIAKRRLRIPRPHFRMPRFGMSHRQIGANPVLPDETSKSRLKEKSPAIRPTAEESVSELEDVRSGKENRSVRSRIRIDAPHPQSSARSTPVPAPAEPAESEPEGVNDWNELPTTKHSNAPEPQLAALASQSLAPKPDDTHPQSDNVEPEEGESDNTSGLQARPDFKGLSKKQRRRLMQEMRDRERAGRG